MDGTNDERPPPAPERDSWGTLSPRRAAHHRQLVLWFKSLQLSLSHSEILLSPLWTWCPPAAVASQSPVSHRHLTEEQCFAAAGPRCRRSARTAPLSCLKTPCKINVSQWGGVTPSSSSSSSSCSCSCSPHQILFKTCDVRPAAAAAAPTIPVLSAAVLRALGVFAHRRLKPWHVQLAGCGASKLTSYFYS